MRFFVYANSFSVGNGGGNGEKGLFDRSLGAEGVATCQRILRQQTSRSVPTAWDVCPTAWDKRPRPWERLEMPLFRCESMLLLDELV